MIDVLRVRVVIVQRTLLIRTTTTNLDGNVIVENKSMQRRRDVDFVRGGGEANERAV
jgi:hypothetical protein